MKRTALILILLLCGAASHAQKLSVSTNAADWFYFITPNADIQYALTQHWSADISARVNAWSFRTGGTFEQRQRDEVKARQQTYSAGVRWWSWTVGSGWWLGARAQFSEYDNGGVGFVPWVPDNEAGEAAGLGVEAGYAYQLSSHWDLGFGLGMWGGRKTYTTYGCPYCGRTTDRGTKTFLLPNEAALSLIYIF